MQEQYMPMHKGIYIMMLLLRHRPVFNLASFLLVDKQQCSLPAGRRRMMIWF